MIAGGVAVSSAAYLFRNRLLLPDRAARTGTIERLLTLSVNGQTRRVDVAPQETLATTLRLQARAHRHEARLRPGGVRRLHGARGRRAALCLLGADPRRTVA